MRQAPNSTSVVFSRSSNRQPPQLSGFHWVGWVKSAHGLKGEIYIQLKSKRADWLEKISAFTLFDQGRTQLLQIESATPFKEGLRVKLKGIDDRNQSESLAKWQVFIEDTALVADPGENLYLNQLLHFQVVNVAGVTLGQVIGFATNGAQDLLKLQTPSQSEALVPFVDAFIVRMDLEKRQIVMELPEGLLDLE